MSEEVLTDHSPGWVGSETQFLNLVNMKHILELLSKTDEQIMPQQGKLKKQMSSLGSRVEG